MTSQKSIVDTLVRKLSYHRMVVEKMLSHPCSNVSLRSSAMQVLERKLIHLEEIVIEIPDDGETMHWDLFISWRDIMIELWARFFALINSNANDDGSKDVTISNKRDVSSSPNGAVSAGTSSPNDGDVKLEPSTSNDSTIKRRQFNKKKPRLDAKRNVPNGESPPEQQQPKLLNPNPNTHRSFRNKNYYVGHPSSSRRVDPASASATAPVDVITLDEEEPKQEQPAQVEQPGEQQQVELQTEKQEIEEVVVVEEGEKQQEQPSAQDDSNVVGAVCEVAAADAGDEKEASPKKSHGSHRGRHSKSWRHPESGRSERTGRNSERVKQQPKQTVEADN